MNFGALLTSLILVSASPVAAQEWVGIQVTETVALGFDRASLRANPEGIAAWTVTGFAATQNDDGVAYDYVITRQVYDCDQDRSKSQVFRAFALDNHLPVFSTNQERPWEYHQPGSVAGDLMDAVCNPENVSELRAFATAEELARGMRLYFEQ